MSHLKRILLAEDNCNDIELMLAALEEGKCGTEIFVTRNGSEGLDHLYGRGEFSTRAAGMPAVILLDIKIPKVNGLQVLRRIRAGALLKTIPVVVLTSSREDHDVQAAYDLGSKCLRGETTGFSAIRHSCSADVLFWTTLNEPLATCFGRDHREFP